ncbi:PIG-L family deacetylase [Desulfobacterales bacterium HSG16]|nr:PIG-L family deacetylase [Desulfobacterales bacterium HSG16]
MDLKKRTSSIFFMTLAVSCILTAYIYNQRIKSYKYNVTQDYNYNFDKNKCEIFFPDLIDGHINLPETEKKWDTGFLEVNVKASWSGKFFNPYIKLSSENLSVKQYFEVGASGLRYINISHFDEFGSPAPQIRLDRYHVSLADKNVRLILFANPEINKSKILVIAPHPDDAEIAAFGLYSDKNSYIVTVTAGDAGGKQYDEVYENHAEHYLKKGELRVWNSITIPMLGGVSPHKAINLGYFDGTLKFMHKDKSTPVRAKFSGVSDMGHYREKNVSDLIPSVKVPAIWNSLVEDFRHLLEVIDPDIIVTPYPAIDKHNDHKLSTLALFEAIVKNNSKKGSLYLYTNHYPLSANYPAGKTGSLISLPPFFDESPVFFQSIYSYNLPVSKQKDKLFALDAMNDLRMDTEWRFGFSLFKRAILQVLNNTLNRDRSYFRRSVRANELFFIMKVKDIYDSEIFEKLKGEIKIL